MSEEKKQESDDYQEIKLELSDDDTPKQKRKYTRTAKSTLAHVANAEKARVVRMANFAKRLEKKKSEVLVNVSEESNEEEEDSESETEEEVVTKNKSKKRSAAPTPAPTPAPVVTANNELTKKLNKIERMMKVMKVAAANKKTVNKTVIVPMQALQTPPAPVEHNTKKEINKKKILDLF